MQVSPKLIATLTKLYELGASSLDIAQLLEELGSDASEEEVYVTLKRINPEVAEAFRREMSLVVWRTDLRKEPFRRERIIRSLVKETGISKSLAEKIAREIEERVRESNLSLITSTLIRELALIKLIEYGLEEAYRKYMRLGIPVYDLLKMSESRELLRDRIAERILVQYSILYLMPKTLVEALFEGYVEVGGIYNPFVPYASTYFTRTASEDRWLEGLGKYLQTRPFVDIPSVYIPPLFDSPEEIRLILQILRPFKAIAWSNEEIEGVVRSEVPVYSFGKVPDKKVLDLVTVDLERIAIHERKPEGFLEKLSHSIEEYRERKQQIVKASNIYIILEGPEELKEKYGDYFSDFIVLGSSE